jgi:predicted nucleic acid-binding protein
VAVTARFLVDTSVAARMANPVVAQHLTPLTEGGVVATTASLVAEALCSARGAGEYEQLWYDRHLAYEYMPTNDEHWQVALGAPRQLARMGRHRSVGVHDLLTAYSSTPDRRTSAQARPRLSLEPDLSRLPSRSAER